MICPDVWPIRPFPGVRLTTQSDEHIFSPVDIWIEEFNSNFRKVIGNLKVREAFIENIVSAY